MKKIIVLLICLLCSNIVQAKEITVPKGTDINVSVKRIVTSKRIPKTYELNSIIKNDVILNNEIIFYAGDPAVLEIGEQVKARGFGRGGRLTVIGGYATDANGQTHKFLVDREFVGANDFWLLRIIPFNKGKQAVIYPSDIFVCKTNRAFIFNTQKAVQKTQYKPQKNFTTNKNNTGNTIQVGIVNKN